MSSRNALGGVRKGGGGIGAGASVPRDYDECLRRLIARRQLAPIAPAWLQPVIALYLLTLTDTWTEAPCAVCPPVTQRTSVEQGSAEGPDPDPSKLLSPESGLDPVAGRELSEGAQTVVTVVRGRRDGWHMFERDTPTTRAGD
uniref:Uncharacterized protein n=1 Tax=Knipowitschia caucasica TaxID=637954 RepID=A0AAV2JYX1_KNICA